MKLWMLCLDTTHPSHWQNLGQGYQQKPQTHRSFIISLTAWACTRRGLECPSGDQGWCTMSSFFHPFSPPLLAAAPRTPLQPRLRGLIAPPGGRGREEAWAGYGSQFGDFGAGIWRTGARSKEEELSRFWRKSPLFC